MIIWMTLLKRLRVRRAYRRTYIELSRLDDRMLKDIDVRRSEIGYIAEVNSRRLAA